MKKKTRASQYKKKTVATFYNPKADQQEPKIPFRDFRWIDPHVIEKVLHSDNYVVWQVNVNKNQILHRIRLQRYKTDTLISDSYQNEELQSDESIVVPQDDLYTIAWETEFEPIFDNPIPYQNPKVIRSREVIENNTPTSPGIQKTSYGQNPIIDPVSDHPTFRGACHSTVNEQNFD